MSTTAFNRRRFARFSLPPAYTPVKVHLLRGERTLEGHAYDLSEGGVQFELDRAVPAGSAVILEITLPESVWTETNEHEDERVISVMGNIVWADDSEPGPVRMALAFTKFANAADRERLQRQITGGKLSRRAA